MTGHSDSPISRHYTSQRLRLHYTEWGSAKKPPLLLLHGGRDHGRNWDWVVDALRDDWHILAPDLRGHGDSQWTSDGGYDMAGFVYDLAQLIEQQQLAPVTLVGHSLGGNIALRYTGLYPDRVRKLVAIEGLGPSPALQAERAQTSVAERWQQWIEQQRELGARAARRYPSINEACSRMLAANAHLSAEQARHLTVHGIRQNEDGSYSWKFDNYVRSWPPVDLSHTEIEALWARIECPTLLIYGGRSWASNPAEDGRSRHFRNARVALLQEAGHWPHHDSLDEFLALLRGFL